MNINGITYAIHPVIPTKIEPCLGLKIARVEITTNPFNDQSNIFDSITDIWEINKQITKVSGITNNNGSRFIPEVARIESLGRNLLKKPSRKPKITNA
jgi:hypothetical protein